MMRASVTTVGGPKALAKQMRRERKAALAAAGLHWHAKIHPEHYTIAAEKRYGYQPRDIDYTRKKAKRYGHRRPLVYTGATEIMTTLRARTTGTSRRVSVRMRGPRYLYQYRKDYRQPDKAAELTTTDDRDIAILERIITDFLGDKFRSNTEIDRLRG